ncbi:MAG: hypothetical protein IIA06_07705 [Proteobacteria bacterium]|nr:hypothetical protein [Pseudomonadota bacterium]
MKQKLIPLVALYKLSLGLPTPIHLEDIAIESKKMSPTSFCWTKYKEHIDLRQVMRTLDELKNEGLITGKNTAAWTLSSKGISMVEDNSLLKSKPQGDIARQRGIYARELQRIDASKVFSNWTNNNSISITDALKLLRIDSYSTENQVKTNITRFEQATKENPKYEKFVEDIKKVINKQ